MPEALTHHPPRTQPPKEVHLGRIRHGVYALPGSDQDPHQDLRAAWLSTDPRHFADDRAYDAASPVVSHVSATMLHGIGELVPSRYSFTAPTRRQTCQPDVHYRQATLDDRDVTVVDGITVTTIPRTVADLAASGTDTEHLAVVVRDATGTGHVDLGDVATALAPYAARYGCTTGGDLVEALLGIAGPPPDVIQVLRHAPSALVSRMVLDQNTAEKARRAATAAAAMVVDREDLARGVAAVLVTVSAGSHDATAEPRYRELMEAVTRRAGIAEKPAGPGHADVSNTSNLSEVKEDSDD